MKILKGTVMQIEKGLINDHLRVSKISSIFRIPTIHNFEVINTSSEMLSFLYRLLLKFNTNVQTENYHHHDGEQ